mmetsp:Transcript_23483/g.55909  ORF Transcript_23483/g.55909 Transcript_23483/m.55909 type:complete len:110 (-) Transcript_23483:266-595(-)
MAGEDHPRRESEHTVMMRRIQLLSDELNDTKSALAHKEEECDELLEVANELGSREEGKEDGCDMRAARGGCARILPSAPPVYPGSPGSRRNRSGISGFLRGLSGACSSK